MSFASRLITRGRLALAATVLLASAAVPLSASAHYLSAPNHRWEYTWSNLAGFPYLLHLYYERDCVSDTANADTSADAWTNTHTPLDYHLAAAPDCGGPRAGRFMILNGNVTGSGLAWTENYHQTCVFFGTYCWLDYNFGQPNQIDAVRIYENHYGSAYDTLNDTERQDVLKHELGHGMGLRHAGYYGGEIPGSGYPNGVYSIMDYCCPSDYTGFPWFLPILPEYNGHDAADINGLYPTIYW
jgi:hypothetical protein